ncbi:MAG: hypothetical protein WA924_13290 [Burkholderiaceae bacterium]
MTTAAINGERLLASLAVLSTIGGLSFHLRHVAEQVRKGRLAAALDWRSRA